MEGRKRTGTFLKAAGALDVTTGILLPGSAGVPADETSALPESTVRFSPGSEVRWQPGVI
jgi:hypothetical protein